MSKGLRFEVKVDGGGRFLWLPFAKFGEEVHLEGAGETQGGPEGDVDIAREKLGDIGAAHMKALRELGLVEAKLLHLANAPPKEGTDEMVDGFGH